MTKLKNRLVDLLVAAFLLAVVSTATPPPRTTPPIYATEIDSVGVALLGLVLFGIYSLLYGRKAKPKAR